MSDASRIINDSLRKLIFVRDQYTNTGDWYGCVLHAITYLEEAARSAPPGSGGGHDHEEARYVTDEKDIRQRLEARESFRADELVFAATSRCPCGAGLAYPEKIGMLGYWDCSAILMGTAAVKGQAGSVQHTGQLPFTFYEVKSERQPSAGGATTRSANVR